MGNLVPLERLLSFLFFKCLPSYDLGKNCMELKGERLAYENYGKITLWESKLINIKRHYIEITEIIDMLF